MIRWSLGRKCFLCTSKAQVRLCHCHTSDAWFEHYHQHLDTTSSTLSQGGRSVFGRDDALAFHTFFFSSCLSPFFHVFSSSFSFRSSFFSLDSFCCSCCAVGLTCQIYFWSWPVVSSPIRSTVWSRWNMMVCAWEILGDKMSFSQAVMQSLTKIRIHWAPWVSF